MPTESLTGEARDLLASGRPFESEAPFVILGTQGQSGMSRSVKEHLLCPSGTPGSGGRILLSSSAQRTHDWGDQVAPSLSVLTGAGVVPHLPCEGVGVGGGSRCPGREQEEGCWAKGEAPGVEVPPEVSLHCW